MKQSKPTATVQRGNSRSANLITGCLAEFGRKELFSDMPSNVIPLIRPYQPTDLDAVIAIFLGAIREVASKDYDEAQINAWAYTDRSIWEERRLSRPTWVAVLDQMIVGFSDLEPSGHLDMMFVHPAYQGIGIASLLLQTVETAAIRDDLSRVFTEASLTAQPFFEKRGFQTLEQQQVAVRGQTFTNFRMEKMIDQ